MIAATIAYAGKPGRFGKTHLVYVSADRVLARSLCGYEAKFRTDTNVGKVECQKCLARMKGGRLW